jgi:hypothetical protein
MRESAVSVHPRSGVRVHGRALLYGRVRDHRVS